MHSPTVMVKFGLMEEALTMSLIVPVARMDRPSRVPRKATSSRAAPHRQHPAQQDLAPGSADTGSLEHAENSVLAEQAGSGGPPHCHQVDGVEPRVGDDARQDGGHPHLGLEEGGHKACRRPGSHGGRDRQDGVACDAHCHRHGRPPG